MHIGRFGAGFSRRVFLDKLGRAAAAGVLAPLWPAWAEGKLATAYPAELLSIDEYTKGKITTGSYIDAHNVDLVKDLLEPIKYEQIAHLGRRIRVLPTTTDPYKLSPWEYVAATERNTGQARFDPKGNVVTADGKPWIGGHPFPAARTAIELFAGLTLNWGRHDASFYPMQEYDVSAEGEVRFQYESGWSELSPIARVSMDPKPYWPGKEEMLRLQSVFFQTPESSRGTSFLNVWAYDQSTFPQLFGYVPAFKRIRQFPTDQRFEPLIPGSTLYLSDAWAAGDPLYTWGNYKIVGRGPVLAAVSNGWNPHHPNWQHTTHGGPRGTMFWDTDVEMVPEAIVCEAEPVRFPRAPLSKKRVWFDARTLLPIAMVTYDRRGLPFHSFDGAYGLYEKDGSSVMDGAHPYWSWAHVHVFDVQSGAMTRLEQVRTISGGHTMRVNDPSIYDKYLTSSALMRLGAG